MAPMGSDKLQKSDDKIFVNRREEILIGEIREMVLSSIYQLLLEETFLLDLFVNYDGDMAMGNNLYEGLIRFLARVSSKISLIIRIHFLMLRLVDQFQVYPIKLFVLTPFPYISVICVDE